MPTPPVRADGEAVFDELPPRLRQRLADDPDQIVYAMARSAFCSAVERHLQPGSQRPQSCTRPCPIVLLVNVQAPNTGGPQYRDAVSRQLHDAAWSLLARWGLSNASNAKLLYRSLIGAPPSDYG